MKRSKLPRVSGRSGWDAKTAAAEFLESRPCGEARLGEVANALVMVGKADPTVQEELRAAYALGGDSAVHGLVASLGEKGRAS